MKKCKNCENFISSGYAMLGTDDNPNELGVCPKVLHSLPSLNCITPAEFLQSNDYCYLEEGEAFIKAHPDIEKDVNNIEKDFNAFTESLEVN